MFRISPERNRKENDKGREIQGLSWVQFGTHLGYTYTVRDPEHRSHADLSDENDNDRQLGVSSYVSQNRFAQQPTRDSWNMNLEYNIALTVLGQHCNAYIFEDMQVIEEKYRDTDLGLVSIGNAKRSGRAIAHSEPQRILPLRWQEVLSWQLWKTKLRYGTKME